MTRRPNPRPIEPDWPRARVAQLRRTVMKKMRKFRASKDFARLAAESKPT